MHPKKKTGEKVKVCIFTKYLSALNCQAFSGTDISSDGRLLPPSGGGELPCIQSGFGVAGVVHAEEGKGAAMSLGCAVCWGGREGLPARGQVPRSPGEEGKMQLGWGGATGVRTPRGAAELGHAHFLWAI